MRYIRQLITSDGTSDADDVWHRIAGEMLNLECGKHFYNRGKWIASTVAPAYPEIFDETDPGKRYSVRIKATYGTLYLPDVDSIDKCRGIIRKIMDIISKEILNHPEVKTALKSLCTIDTNSQGLTAVKAKTISEKCHANSHHIFVHGTIPPTEFYQRIFTWSSNPLNTNNVLRSTIPCGRFIWCITPLQELYSFIGREIIASEANMSLVTSIVYDNINVLNLPDDALWFKSLRLSIFVHFGTFKNILAYGDFTGIRSKDIMSIGSIDEPKPFGSSLVSNIHEAVKHAWKYYKQEEHKAVHYPGYIPETHTSKNTIIYNTVFKTAWEIMRWFSPLWYKLFPSDHCIGANLLREFRESDIKKLYTVDYNDVKITNSSGNDKCELCMSPLYDDIYCLFASKSNNSCKAFCPLCLHACFQRSPNLTYVYLTSDNIRDNIVMGGDYSEPLYIQDLYEVEIIARTRYPRTFDDIVDNEITYPGLNLCEYKNIIKLAYHNKPIIIKDTSRYVHGYLGIGKNDYEHIAGIIGTYAFAISPMGKIHRLLQRSYYKNVPIELDKLTFIPLSYFEAKEVKPMLILHQTELNMFSVAIS